MMCLIFCLPHAGGGAHHYVGWADYLDQNIEWKPLDYAGHFSRMDEPTYQTFDQAVKDLANEIMVFANGRPFGLFGHSMGGAIAYEIANLMQEQQLTESVLFIVVSSTFPPHRHDPNTPHSPRYYDLSDRDFIKHLIDTGGIKAQLAEHSDLMAKYLPLIRQDYRLYQQYQPKVRLPLAIPLYALWGNQEDESNKEMIRWADYCDAFAGTKAYSGGHFYWQDSLSTVTADLSHIARQSTTN
jgi:surfactin synthase thioesterase subunit